MKIAWTPNYVYRCLAKVILILIDSAIIYFTFYIARNIVFSLAPALAEGCFSAGNQAVVSDPSTAALFLVFFICIAWNHSLYTLIETDYAWELTNLVISLFYTTMSILFIRGILQSCTAGDAAVIIFGAALMLLVMGIARFFSPRIVSRFTDVFKLNCVVLCDAATSREALDKVVATQKVWLKFAGVVLLQSPMPLRYFNGYPYLGSLENLEHIDGVQRINAVCIVAADWLSSWQIENQMSEKGWVVQFVRMCPEISDVAVTSVKGFAKEKNIVFEMHHKILFLHAIWVKRAFDIVFSLLALLLLSPVFIVISIFIKLDSPGPVLFGHKRVGKNFKEFKMLKFRTMYRDAEKKLVELLDSDPETRNEWNEKFKLTRDPRITRMGGFLRKTSLDELPQLINVLQGHISIVGPRPIIKDEIKKYGVWYNLLFHVKPGMTGLWQVSGRSDIAYERRVRLDMFYIRNWGLRLDLYIIFKTVGVLLSQLGAY